MRMVYGLTATAAEFTPDGRVWVLGGDFDTFGVPQFPATIQFMTLVVKILAQPAECGRERTLRVELWDPDGTAIQQPIIQTFRVERNAQYSTRPVGAGFVLNMQGITFPREGDYAFHVLVDDNLVGTLPVYLIPQKQQGES